MKSRQDFYKVPAWGSFSTKVKIKGMSSTLSEFIAKQAVSKELLCDFYEIKVSGGVYILKIDRIFLFKGALKTRFTFSNQTKVVNKGTESIRRALCFRQCLSSHQVVCRQLVCTKIG